jgi:lipooligosaccharide transport system permease protein
MTARSAARYFESRMLVYRRTWRGSVISSFLNPVMFLAAMGLGLGSLVDEGGGQTAIAGLSYLAFLAPGLMAATTMQSATGDCTWPVMAAIKWLKTYDATLATPIGVADLVAGHLAFVTARMTAVALIYGLIATMFGAMSLGGALLATLPAALTGLAFAAPTVAFTASLDKETGLVNLYRFGIVPMFLFSGTFFPISQLPNWLEPLAQITPLWHGVELARAAALGTDPSWPVFGHLVFLLAVIAAGSVLAVRFLRLRLIS